MQLSQDSHSGKFRLQAYDPDKFVINKKDYSTNLILGADHLLIDCLPEKLNELTIEHLKPLLDLKPEIIIIGTGSKQQLLSAEFLHVFQQQHIGIEVMNTAAACRTLNVLLAENRFAFAALFL